MVPSVCKNRNWLACLGPNVCIFKLFLQVSQNGQSARQAFGWFLRQPEMNLDKHKWEIQMDCRGCSLAETTNTVTQVLSPWQRQSAGQSYRTGFPLVTCDQLHFLWVPFSPLDILLQHLLNSPVDMVLERHLLAIYVFKVYKTKIQVH